jgi:hypothetical protein
MMMLSLSLGKDGLKASVLKVPEEPDLKGLTAKQRLRAQQKYVSSPAVPLWQVRTYFDNHWAQMLADLREVPPGLRFRIIYEFARLFTSESPDLVNMWLKIFLAMWDEAGVAWWQVGLSRRTVEKLKRQAYGEICERLVGYIRYGAGMATFAQLITYMNAAKLQPNKIGLGKRKFRDLKRVAQNNDRGLVLGLLSPALPAKKCVAIESPQTDK